MEIKQFNRICKYSDKQAFAFTFEGIPRSDNIDKQKLQKLLRKFMYPSRYHNDIKEDVGFIRRIFEDYDETSLSLVYVNPLIKKTIRFKNSAFSSFECSSDISNHYDFKYVVDDTTNKINVMFTTPERENDWTNVTNVGATISGILRDMAQFDHIETVEFPELAEVLTEVYRLFYNENPDFSDKNILIKMRTMKNVLWFYNVQFLGEKTYLLSMIESTLPKLFPFGEVKKSFDSVEFDEATKAKISLIGNEIREAISDMKKPIDGLSQVYDLICSARFYGSRFSSGELEYREYVEAMAALNCTTVEFAEKIRVLSKKLDTKFGSKKD